MRVFSVEMLVKEEGAAVVQAALGRLKKETAAVAAEMKATTAQVTSTGRAMQQAGQATEIAKDRAAKAAIGFAAVGQSFARTGSLTADAGTRIVEAGSQISMMFGPGGLAFAALLAFGAAALTNFTKARDEAKKLADELNKSVREMVTAGDTARIDKRLQEIRQGLLDVASGQLLGGLDDLRAQLATATAALSRLSDEWKRLEQFQTRSGLLSPQQQRTLSALNAQKNAVNDLRKQIAALEREEALLVRGRQLAPQYGAVSTRAPRTATPAATIGLPSAAGLPRSADVLAAVQRDFDDLLRVKIPQAIGPAVADLSNTIYGKLGIGIASAIQGGVVSGLQAAIATGNIGDAFKALGQAIVSSLASAMVDVALAAIGFGRLLADIQLFMANHPALAVASAVALLALAKSMGGSAKVGGMAATGGPSGLTYSAASGMSAPTSQIIFGGTSATTAAGMTPRSATNVTIIGPNDPTAQRAMQELLAKANSRGRIG